MRMWVYVVRRVALLVPVVIGVMTITFILVTALGPTQQLYSAFGPPPIHGTIHSYNPTIPCSEITPGANGTCANPLWDELAPKLGLNQPIVVQWGFYIYRAFTFQWGLVSNFSEMQGPLAAFIHGQSVSTVLAELLPYTLELAIFSLIIILAVAVPLGNLSAVYRNRPVDQASRVMSFSGFALPAFLLATVLVLAVVLILGTGTLVHTPWCPGGETSYSEITGSWPTPLGCGAPGGGGPISNFYYPSWLTYGIVSHPTGFPTVDAMIHGNWWLALDSILRMIIPALVIAFGTIAILLRFVRNSMLEVMNLDFVRTARAKGAPESTVVKRHAGRNSLNVTITVLGLTFAFFIGGFPIIEDVFQLNGIGYILALSVLPGQEDFALIFGATLLFTFLVVAANIIVDVLYAYLDPRVRLG
jgi:peptide/nickel transport system permease protein